MKVIKVCDPWTEPALPYEDRAEGVMWPEFQHLQVQAFRSSLSCNVQALNGRGIITCGGTIVASSERTAEGYQLTLSHEHGPEWGADMLEEADDPPG